MPVRGVFHSDPSHLQFHWLSMRTVYTVLYISGGTFIASLFLRSLLPIGVSARNVGRYQSVSYYCFSIDFHCFQSDWFSSLAPLLLAFFSCWWLANGALLSTAGCAMRRLFCDRRTICRAGACEPNYDRLPVSSWCVPLLNTCYFWALESTQSTSRFCTADCRSPVLTSTSRRQTFCSFTK